MKIVLALIVFILFVQADFIQPKPQIYPAWYKNRSLKPLAKYEFIGYGLGETFKEAQSVAKSDIAQALISNIDSSMTSKKISISDNTYKKQSISTLIVTSKLTLHNVKIIKQEKIDNIFYVALKYKNLDLAYRIKTTIANIECSAGNENSYLLQTPLIKKLTISIGCELDFKLDRRNEAWYLKYKEHLFLLSDDEFEELYITKISDKFEFISNKRVLSDGDSFYFKVNSKEEGYVTLLNVYENGIVTLLQPSIAIKNSIQVPPKDSEDYFEAGLVKEDKNTYDLYVAIYTKKPLDMSRFEYANEDLAESELAYKFDELIGVMSKYKYSSILLRTRVK